MNTVYPAPLAFVKPTPGVLTVTPVGISRRLLAFYALVVNRSRKYGFCFASNGWFEARCGVNRATVQRWVSRLVALGWLRREDTPGVERRLIPLRPLAGLAGVGRRAVKCGGVAAPQRIRNGAEENNRPAQKPEARPVPKPVLPSPDKEPEAPAVAALTAHGIRRPVARALVAENGPEIVAAQVEALAYRKADSPAAVLVASIKGAWDLPRQLKVARDTARHAAAQREKEAARAALAREQEARRCQLADRWAAVAAPERDRLTKQARELLAAELGFLWDRASEASKARQVEARALRLFAASEGRP